MIKIENLGNSKAANLQLNALSEFGDASINLCATGKDETEALVNLAIALERIYTLSKSKVQNAVNNAKKANLT
jgi:hypothetical protein